jgi:hypothetical protein
VKKPIEKSEEPMVRLARQQGTNTEDDWLKAFLRVHRRLSDLIDL